MGMGHGRRYCTREPHCFSCGSPSVLCISGRTVDVSVDSLQGGVMREGSPVVHVVDDDESSCAALIRLLKANDFECAAYGSTTELSVARALDRPGCIVLDVNLPGLSGIEFFEGLRHQGVHPAVVFLTGFGDIPMTVRAMNAGAVDFLTKPFDGNTFLQAVARAIERDAALRQKRDEIVSIRIRYGRLTPREKQVFAHVVAGRLNKQIAYDLQAAIRTVKAHRAQVMQKMQVRTVADLVRLAGHLDIKGIEPLVARSPVRSEFGQRQEVV